MKKKSNISIKAKLLGIIIPVVIAIILILVFTAYHVSSGIIESYSQNLLESSVNSQASKIEAWLEENLASMQMAKTMIEKLHPDETQLPMSYRLQLHARYLNRHSKISVHLMEI